jgi:hypothetical protein
MLQGGQVDQGVQMLKKIVIDNPGTRAATEAHKELRFLNEFSTRTTAPSDARLHRFRNAWAEVQSLDDGRIPKLLLVWRPEIETDVDCLDAVVSKLKALVEEALAKQLELRDLDRFEGYLSAAVQTLPMLSEPLSGPRKRLDQLHFEVRLKQAREQIRGALNDWNTSEAWTLYGDLEKWSPPECRPLIADLQISIAHTEQARDLAQEALDNAHALSGSVITERSDYFRYREVVAGLKAKLRDSGPPFWKVLLEAQRRQIDGPMRAFLQTQSEEVSDLPALLAFADLFDIGEEDPDLIERALQGVEKGFTSGILIAEDTHRLEALRDELREVMRIRPAIFGGRLKPLENGLQCLIAAWRESGAEHVPAVPAGFPVPDALDQHLRRWGEARTRLTAQIEEAVSSWRIDDLIELSQSTVAPDPYRRLAANPTLFRDLARLATMPDFSSVAEGRIWFTDWDSAVSNLGRDIPATLGHAINREHARRHTSLDELKYRDRLRSIDTEIRAGRLEQAEVLATECQDSGPELERYRAQILLARAQQAGDLEVIRLLSERWRELQFHIPTQAGEALLAAARRAWEADDQNATERLAVVVRRARHDRRIPETILKEAADLVEWASLEQQARVDTSVPTIRRLWSHIQAHQSSQVVWKGLCRLVQYWTNHDLVAATWADRALANWEPPVVVGAEDPFAKLTLAWDEAAAEAVRQMSETYDWTKDKIAAMEARFTTCDTQRDHVNRLLGPETRLEPSSLYVQVRNQARLLARTISDLEELEQADLRQPVNGGTWESVRLRLQREMPSVAAAPRMLASVDRFSPVTRMAGLEQSMLAKATACRNPDAETVFPDLALQVREIVDRFEKCGIRGRSMWRTVSSEYWRKVREACGDLTDLNDPVDLSALAIRIDDLERDEKHFLAAMDHLRESLPPTPENGPFDPELHRDYLALFPTDAPQSDRVRGLFLRFLRQEPRPTIIRQSVRFLPNWIAELLFSRR